MLQIINFELSQFWTFNWNGAHYAFHTSRKQSFQCLIRKYFRVNYRVSREITLEKTKKCLGGGLFVILFPNNCEENGGSDNYLRQLFFVFDRFPVADIDIISFYMQQQSVTIVNIRQLEHFLKIFEGNFNLCSKF